MTTKAPKKDVYELVTNQIIEAIEQGAGDWKMPWHCDKFNGMPVNISSGNEYKGVNIVSLWVSALVKEYTQPVWATYRQWKEKGAQVKKGEKGSTIIYYNVREVTNKTTGEVEEIPFIRSSTVFNVAQVEGYELPNSDEPLPNVAERIAHAEQFVSNTKAKITYTGQRAFYSPSTDEIVMPEQARFNSTEAMYSTLLHELTHFTGHKSRCDRSIIDSEAKSTKEAYAREELVAELGSAMLCSSLGIKSQIREDHAAYIESWLTVLRDDKKAIFKAAAMAQKAADYLHSLQPETASESVAEAA